ncbi:biotin--[acetyl-CoA-carboxylase] ligase [Fructilactobacillus sp. Tb1]|uniref:biotin--[acetyl-CoA-carboxylase] ligase n=1 Tax=Fructilactobacillus sp. Tb1 TaxID=3422304 RepID=UPI003D2808D8
MNLDEAKILDNIHQPLSKLVVFDEIDSTMNYAQTNSWSGLNLVIADHQTAGKGQHGHSFSSPATGIYETIITPAYKLFIANPGMLTLGIGVCVQQAIKDVLDITTQLKWVNDIYYHEKKCGGILVETKTNNENQFENFVIGIGLNLVANEILDQVNATSLTQNNDFKNELIAQIYNLIVLMFQHPNEHDIIRKYQQHMIWKHKLVSIIVGNHQISGKITGITDDFRLVLVDQTGKKHHLTSEESQHLRIQ